MTTSPVAPVRRAAFAFVFVSLFTQTLALSIDGGFRWQVPGAAFLLAAVILIIAIAIARRVTKRISPLA